MTLVLFPYKFIDGIAELIPENDMATEYPLAWDYLNTNKNLLSRRESGKFKGVGWYQLYPKNLDVWEQPKLLVPYMVTRLGCVYDETGKYFVNVTTGGFGVTTNQKIISMRYLAALLNSKLLNWFFKMISTNFRHGYFGANKQFLVQLPIRIIDFSNPAEESQYKRMVKLVDRMHDLHKQLSEAQMESEKRPIEEEIEATDHEIDQLVYKLYDLTEEEIEIVEETTKRQ